LAAGGAQGAAADGGRRARARADRVQRRFAAQQGGQVQADAAHRMDDLGVVRILAQQRVPDVRSAAVVVVRSGDMDARWGGFGVARSRHACDGVLQQQRGVGRIAAQFEDQGVRYEPAVRRKLAQGVQRKAVAKAFQQRIDLRGIARVGAICDAIRDGFRQGGAQGGEVQG